MLIFFQNCDFTLFSSGNNNLSRVKLYEIKKCEFPNGKLAKCDYKSMRLNFRKTYQKSISRYKFC